MSVVTERLKMELEEAVEILNAHKHRGFADWQILDQGDWQVVTLWRDVHTDPIQLDAFEAIAIAEKYERDGIK
jgi:hypothetical protein